MLTTKQTDQSTGLTLKSDVPLFDPEELSKQGYHMVKRDTYTLRMKGEPGSTVYLNKKLYGDVPPGIVDENGNVSFTVRAGSFLNKSETLPVTDPYWSEYSSRYSTPPQTHSWEEMKKRGDEEKAKGIGIPDTDFIGLYKGVYQLATLAERAREQDVSIEEYLEKQKRDELAFKSLEREKLSLPERFVYDLEAHLRDSGYDVNTNDVLENTQMVFDSLLWGLEGGFLEKDQPVVRDIWRVGTLPGEIS